MTSALQKSMPRPANSFDLIPSVVEEVVLKFKEISVPDIQTIENVEVNRKVIKGPT